MYHLIKLDSAHIEAKKTIYQFSMHVLKESVRMVVRSSLAIFLCPQSAGALI